MAAPLVITLPITDTTLRDELTTDLTPYADVQEQPASSFDLATIALYVAIIGGSVEIATNAVEIVNKLGEIRERAKKNGKPSGIKVGAPGERGVPLEAADDALLRRLLGVE